MGFGSGCVGMPSGGFDPTLRLLHHESGYTLMISYCSMTIP
uniref:Uncharacterized protein n=1 Tax=Picea glauca TaxID=3330 RepID=A0A101LZP4_PICGL|nr:hypothetical protein ABT39_MTgene5175 [Picea glauca]